MERFDDSISRRNLVCNFGQFNSLYFGCECHKWDIVAKRIPSFRGFHQYCGNFLGSIYSILWKNQVSYSAHILEQFDNHLLFLPEKQKHNWSQMQMNIKYKPQFYIQLLYMPHFGPWLLPFGLLGSKREISETTEFLLR